jgi:hypothetical protein
MKLLIYYESARVRNAMVAGNTVFVAFSKLRTAQIVLRRSISWATEVRFLTKIIDSLCSTALKPAVSNPASYTNGMGYVSNK